MTYGEAKGKLALYANIFRATRFLETVMEQVADRFAWPAPIVVEMRSCGAPNARWTIPTRTLHVCYELAQEFVELYRDFGGDRSLAELRLTPAKRPTVRPQNIAQSIGAWKRLHGSGVAHSQSGTWRPAGQQPRTPIATPQSRALPYTLEEERAFGRASQPTG